MPRTMNAAGDLALVEASAVGTTIPSMPGRRAGAADGAGVRRPATARGDLMEAR